jgi:hypothetical protein
VVVQSEKCRWHGSASLLASLRDAPWRWRSWRWPRGRGR